MNDPELRHWGRDSPLNTWPPKSPPSPSSEAENLHHPLGNEMEKKPKEPTKARGSGRGRAMDFGMNRVDFEEEEKPKMIAPRASIRARPSPWRQDSFARFRVQVSHGLDN